MSRRAPEQRRFAPGHHPGDRSPTADLQAPVGWRPRWFILAGVVANVLTLTWTSLAVLVTGRGLGLGNEGFYLLSYENWDRNPRNFTGVQYLYGPIFDLIGHDVAMLRVVRLALVLGVHVLFGVSFARWLRLHRPQAPPGPVWEYCVASLVVASGAVMYGWLPPTPGYNDVTLLGSMTMVALLLVHLRAVELGRAAPRWTGVVWGFTGGAIVLAKPPSIISVLLLAAVFGYAVRKAGGRLLPTTLGVVVGASVFVAYVQVVVMPWGSLVPPLREQLGVVASHSDSPIAGVLWYVESSLVLARAAALVCAPTALAALVAHALRHRICPDRRAVLVLVGLAASVALLAGAGGLRARADNVLAYSSGIVAMLILVVASTAGDRHTWRVPTAPTTVVVVLLALTPALQGVGTHNALYSIAVNGSAFWVALMLFLLSRARPRLAPGFVLGASATALAVLLTVVIGLDGMSHDGHGRSLLAGPRAPVTGSAELSSIELPAAEAATYSRLRKDLGINPGNHHPMLALGELSHYVLILGGRPIGNPWHAVVDDGLNGADLRAACRHGNPWGQDQPLVVASRDPSADELAAWRTCGIDFARDYADVTPPSAPAGVKILRWQPAPGTPAPTSAGDSSASG